jgi:type I restriction enzyme S subunit
VKKLGEIATIVRGASPRPIEDPKWFDENSSIGWVRISDVTKSIKILTDTTQKLSELGILSSRYVAENNLIMSICATVGRPILTRINVCIHDGFVVFRNPQIEINYLYYYLSFIEKDWSKNGQTGSQMNLNTTLINTTEIPIPPTKEEQTHIATILSDMDAEIAVLETKLEKYRNIKLGMMQELLTGKIRLV